MEKLGKKLTNKLMSKLKTFKVKLLKRDPCVCYVLVKASNLKEAMLKHECESGHEVKESRTAYCGCGAEMGEYEEDNIGVCQECM